MTVEKSLKEVWIWKDALYNDTRNLTKEEELAYFKNKTDDFLNSLGYKKKAITAGSYKIEKVQ